MPLTVMQSDDLQSFDAKQSDYCISHSSLEVTVIAASLLEPNWCYCKTDHNLNKDICSSSPRDAILSQSKCFISAHWNYVQWTRMFEINSKSYKANTSSLCKQCDWTHFLKKSSYIYIHSLEMLQAAIEG